MANSSSLANILTAVLAQTFQTVCGTWQSKKAEPKAFLVSFSIPIDHTKESGYRQVEFALYAEYNYVGVYTRECWNVIPLEDLEYNEGDDEEYIKEGKDYSTGNSGWTQVISHDTCWRDAVREFIFKNIEVIQTFSGSCDFYRLVDPTPFRRDS